MPINWTLVFSAGSAQEAELVRGLLEQHGINAVIMDQGSRSYPPLASVEVYVERDEAVRARHLLHKAPDA